PPAPSPAVRRSSSGPARPMATAAPPGRSDQDAAGPDRQVPLAPAGGVPYGVGDGGGGADDADLSEAFHAGRVQLAVVLVDPADGHGFHIGVGRDVVAAEV